MKSSKLIAVAAVLICIGWIAAGGISVNAQSQTESESSDGPWQMFGGNVAGTGGSGGSGGSDILTGSTGLTGWPVRGSTWLYNTDTGKTYRVYDNCGDDAENGCLYPLPIVSGDATLNYQPSPMFFDGSTLGH